MWFDPNKHVFFSLHEPPSAPQDHSDIRYAVAGHSAYSMLAQVQRDMRTSKYAEKWAPYLRTGSGKYGR